MALSPEGRLAPAADPTPPGPPPRTPGGVPTAAPPRPTLCPRCGGKLTNPDGLGWCPGCGYCHSLEEEKGKVAVAAPETAAPKKPSALGAAEFGEAMKRVPGWAWPLLGGMAVVAGASVAANHLLPEECLARALWSAVQMVLCVVGLIAAQLWAVLLVGAGEDGLGAKDVILPGRLWRAAFRHLPATRKPVWLGAWCLTGLICGGAVVGGFNYWLEALQAKRLREIAEALAADAPDAKGKDTAREDKEPAAELPRKGPGRDDKRPVAQCVVIGYQTDGKNVTGLVLATTDGDRLKFAGVVQEGISPALGKDLRGKLSRLVRDEPLIPGLTLKGTVWVKPGVFCDVSHSGAGKQGQLEEPALKGLME